MTKEEWKQFFEEINSREPSKEELEQALVAGEYTEEKPKEKEVIVETIKVIERNDNNETVETPVEEPVKPQASKVKSIKDNESVAQVTNTTKNYFSWLWETLKHPVTKGDNYNQSYPWITMGLISLFIALTVTLYLRGMSAAAINPSAALLGAYTNNSVAVINPFGFKFFIIALICVAVLIIALVFATWVGLKTMASPLTFTNVVDKYASLYVPIVFLMAISFVLTLITLKIIGLFVLGFALFILALSWYFVIFSAENKRKLDDYYSKMIAIICSAAIFGAIYTAVLVFVFVRIFTSLPSLF